MKKKNTIKVLLIEDDEDDYILFKEMLDEIKNVNYKLSWIADFDKGVELITQKNHDIYIFDYLLGKHTGIDLLKKCNELEIQAPIILLTGLANQDTDIAAVQMGAADYLEKSKITPVTLERSMRHAAAQSSILKELKASEKKFRSIFENSYDVIYIAKMDGSIVDVNPAAERLFGYSREELLKMKARDFYENQEERKKLTQILNENGVISNYEVTLRDKNGNKKYCIVNGVIQVMDENGEAYHQGILRDITQRRKIEKDLLIAEKNAVIGKVVHTLAHEIRSPLASIYLATELLQKELKSDTLYLDILKRSSRQIDNIIKDFLQSATLPEVQIAKHSINDIINATIALANDRAILKKISIETSLEKTACNIMADGEKLKIALVNILVNAIEAVKENEGKISICTFFNSDKINIEIRDNGPGIPEASLAKIFEPYYTSKPNGIGLGLAATHNIIHSLNGSIDVESEIGKGTKFMIGLQCNQE